MAASFDIEAEFRADAGKGASRRLRHSGKVPAILYGGGEPPRALTLDHDDLMHHLEHEAFYSHILNLKVGDKEQAAILKDLQRHPSRRAVLHVDFQRVVAGEKIRMSVPLHFMGEDESPGKRQGGLISHVVSDVEISCLPRNLPEFLEVDVSQVELDQVLHLSDITLPEGVELTESSGQDHPIMTITLPKVEAEPEDDADVGGGEAEGEAAPEAE